MTNTDNHGGTVSAQTRRGFLAATASFGAVAVAGCSGSANNDGAVSTAPTIDVTHGAVKGGTTGGLVNVIIQAGIDSEHNLNIKPEYFTSPPKVQKQIVYNQQIPTGFMGSIVATRLRGSEEAANPEIAGPYQLYHMHVLAQKDSDITGPADLAGKKISWASKSADAWLKFVTVLNLDHGISPDDIEFVQTAPPASIELLRKGELDAILQYEPLVTKALIDNDFEVVYSPRKAWQELKGMPLTTVDLAWSQNWYQNNSEVASRLADSFKQGQQYINDNLATVLEENSELYGLETNEQVSLAKERLTNIYPSSWSDDLFDSEYQIVERANELGLVDATPTREIFREV